VRTMFARASSSRRRAAMHLSQNPHQTLLRNDRDGEFAFITLLEHSDVAENGYACNAPE
jgi:hypothetical protein